MFKLFTEPAGTASPAAAAVLAEVAAEGTAADPPPEPDSPAAALPAAVLAASVPSAGNPAAEHSPALAAAPDQDAPPSTPRCR